MEMPVICDLRKSHIVVSACKRQIPYIDDGLQLCRIRIPPECVSFGSVPRQRSRDLDAPCQLVEGKILEIRVIAENKVQIINAVLQNAGPRLIMQMLHPVIISLRELRFCLRKLFLCRKHPDLFILHGKFAHCRKGSLVILITETVDTDQVESIAQLQICRVLRMMRVNKLTPFDDLDACHTGTLDQMPAVLVVGRLINIGEVFFDCLGNREVNTVKKTDRSFLCQRILNRLRCRRVCPALTRRGRKSCRVFPFRMC